jgi:O-antigen/teichoic acid export membrane protein
VNAREAYRNNWSALPRRTGTDGYNNYDPTTYSDVVTLGTVGATASIIGVGFLLVSNPVGWVALAAGTATVVGGGVALYQWAADGFANNYPIMRLPVAGGNGPHMVRASSPTGFYR